MQNDINIPIYLFYLIPFMFWGTIILFFLIFIFGMRKKKKKENNKPKEKKLIF